nr:unnamed protein product [Callosobruchus analis]
MLFSNNDNFFETVEFCNKLCGAWLESGNSTRNKKIFHMIYSAALLIYGLFFYVLQVMMLRTTIEDLKQFFRHIGMLSAHLLGLLKFSVIMVNHKKLARIKAQLQSKDFTYEPTFDADKQTAIARRTCHKLVIVIYILYYMVGGSAHITALWKLNFEQKGKYFDQNATCYDFTPYFFVIPFDTEKTNSCRYAFIMMNMGFSVLGLYLAAYDALFCSLLTCLRTKLEIVSEATKMIRERVIPKMGLAENFRPFRDEELPAFESEMYDEIRRCNLHLALLLR